MTAALWWQSVVAGVQRWRWTDLLVGAGLGLLCLLYMGGPLEPDAWKRNWLAPLAYNVLQFGLPMVLAMRVADAAVDRGAPALPLYAFTVLGVAAAGVWVLGPLLMPLLGSDPGWNYVNDLWLAVGVAVLFALGVAGYAQWRAAHQALARAHAAEAAQARRAQQLASAKLLALQARVDPTLLFDALGRVADTIDADTAAADALLADAITLLRGLLPSALRPVSTLGRELDLVAVQARVTAHPARPAPPLTLDVPDDTRAAELAPTLLTGLLRSLGNVSEGWHLRARHGSADSLELQLTANQSSAQATQAVNALDLSALAMQLRAVHGDATTLTRQPPGGLTMQLPYQVQPDHDPSADR